MKKKVALFLSVFLLISSVGIAQQAQQKGLKKKVFTTKATGENALVIDGFIDEAVWETVDWAGDFTQREPADGEKPAQQTAFKILYDDKNLYVAIRAFDDEPDKIAKRMSRRDGFEGDWVEINIDSYYDLRSAFSFTASVSGVKGDEAVSNNGDEWDASWDPIWYLKTSVDDKGWVAEFRIPLSQLRFTNKENLIWGLQLTRFNFRKGERSNWQYIPKNSPGWVHLFGELHGLAGIKPQKQVEIQPYVVARMQRFEKEEGNPFVTGKGQDISAGLDGKIGITSDITLDFTVNPDFGQVEADPSQVNLTAFEVFFQEQRPFFVESKNILDYQVTSSVAGGRYTSDNLFYSRRIGRPPQYNPEIKEGEYVKMPDNASILGAFKFTGKTRKGLSFGLLESVTGRERAEIDWNGQRRKETVEPLTNYLVARVQQDFNKGNTIIGGMFTATNRNIENENLSFLHRSAYSGGLDFVHNWKERKYFVSGNLVLSHVAGASNAITQTQLSGQRFFQRPNASHIEVDSSRNSLSGTGGTVKFGKSGGGNIRFETGLTWRSPGLELNDIGFLRSADQINQWAWIGYQVLKPFKIFRNIYFNLNGWRDWDFSGVNTYNSMNFNARTQFKNFWWIGSGITPDFMSISNADLRGGPALLYPGGWGHWYFINSDSRKKLQLIFEHSNFWGKEHYSRNQSFWLKVVYRPVNALEFSVNPSFSLSNQAQQYVATTDFGAEKRYITANIEQQTLSLSLRLNYIIRPNLSIQYYGQPFASKGTYSQFKRIIAPKADNYNRRFHSFTGSEISYQPTEEKYLVDENKDGTTDYEISNPDFNFMQFRSNLVARWEYIPGSTLFVVWSQGRTGSPHLDSFTISRISGNLFDITPHNIFLIKYTYRFRL